MLVPASQNPTCGEIDAPVELTVIAQDKHFKEPEYLVLYYFYEDILLLQPRIGRFRYRTIKADDRRQRGSIDELVSNDGNWTVRGSDSSGIRRPRAVQSAFLFDRGWTGERPRLRDRTGPTIAISGSISSRLESYGETGEEI